MAAAGDDDLSDGDTGRSPPLCLALLRSACHTVAADGGGQKLLDGPQPAAVVTDGPRRSRPAPETADADAFFEYDLDSGQPPPLPPGHGRSPPREGGGGGADTGCALTSPADRTDGSGDGSPRPPATATAAVAGTDQPDRTAAEQPPAGDTCGSPSGRRHLYENPLADTPGGESVPEPLAQAVAAAEAEVASSGSRRGRSRAPAVTDGPQPSPSEKVDAWLLTCEQEAADTSEEPCPPEDGAQMQEDAAPGENTEDGAADDDTDEALTEADELDIGELLSRGCQLLELDLERAPVPAPERGASEPDHPTADHPDHPEPAQDEDTTTTTESESGVSSSEFLIPEQLMKRSSSLKSSKTPPLTPGRKKYVRFADALGLELQHVRTFKDEVPVVPRSAFAGLADSSPDEMLCLSDGGLPAGVGVPGMRQLVPMFLPAASGLGFEERLRREKVCLISVSTHQEDWSVRGVVRVLNMDYYKSVCVRYTLDEWRTWAEAVASYVQGSCDGFADRFHFTLYCSTLTAGQRLHFAIVFRCLGQEFWDNNHGADYTVLCAAQQQQRAAPPDDWGGGRF